MNEEEHAGAEHGESRQENPTLTKPAGADLSIAFVGTYPPRRCGIATFTRDVSAATAAMVAAAMSPDSTPESILSVLADVDPHGYFEARLVGRLAWEMLREAREIVHAARRVEPVPAAGPPRPPLGSGAAVEIHPWANSGMSPAERAQLEAAYLMLDAKKQRMPFHAGEIHLVNLTALLFSGFDFPTALSFVVNWGRDNDTTAAVTGAILGAYLGAAKLPETWVRQSLEKNRGLGIDLEALADRLTTAILER